MNNNKSTAVWSIAVLILATIFFGFKYFETKSIAHRTQAALDKTYFNVDVLDFTSEFIQNVLKAENEVSFETRLMLETKVRELNDPEILTQWQKFTNSENEGDAQENVKNLLETLISKVKN